MTDGEALKLQPGDPLVGVISGRLAVLEVAGGPVPIPLPGLRVRVLTRRLGKTRQGARFPATTRPAAELRRLPALDAPAFHVAADWLDEHDEPMAAMKLRRAFPLGGGPGVPAAGAGGG